MTVGCSEMTSESDWYGQGKPLGRAAQKRRACIPESRSMQERHPGTERQRCLVRPPALHYWAMGRSEGRFTGINQCCSGRWHHCGPGDRDQAQTFHSVGALCVVELADDGGVGESGDAAEDPDPCAPQVRFRGSGLHPPQALLAAVQHHHGRLESGSLLASALQERASWKAHRASILSTPS